MMDLELAIIRLEAEGHEIRIHKDGNILECKFCGEWTFAAWIDGDQTDADIYFPGIN